MRNFYLAAFVVLLLSSVALAYSCTDSDGGKNYNVKGTITYYVNGVQYTLTDTCDSSPAYADLMVFERYCLDDGGTAGLTYFCPNGCSDGACVSAQTTTTAATTTTVPSNGTTTTIAATTTVPTTTVPATTTTVPASACLDTSAQCQSAPDVSVYGPAGAGSYGGGSDIVQKKVTCSVVLSSPVGNNCTYISSGNYYVCYFSNDTGQRCAGLYNATGQTFIPTRSGYLAKADLYLSRHLALLGGTIPVEVRSNGADGQLLTNKIINVTSLPVNSYGTKIGPTTIVFDTTPYLTAGNTYAILIRSDRNWVVKEGWGGTDVYWDVEFDAIQGNATL